MLLCFFFYICLLSVFICIFLIYINNKMYWERVREEDERLGGKKRV